MNYYGSHIPSGRTVFDPRTLSQPIPGTTAVPDFSQFVAEALLKPVLDGFNTAAKNLADTMTPRGPASAKASPVGYHKHHRHDYDCRCHHEDCGCHKDPCHCNCCIVDADLIVYARLGEVRVIPLFLENTWRRERKIITELSPWTSRGGNPAPIKGKLLPPAPEFTLPPCGHQTLTLVVEIEGIPKEGRLPDVDDCTVAYADLRVQGCDIRPIRIAIATLPRDCEAYEIECGCQCCC
jgi:hypothetical protein